MVFLPALPVRVWLEMARLFVVTLSHLINTVRTAGAL